MMLGATAAALLGGLTEVFLLRPLRHSPPLYPLVATFGLSLVIHDVLLWALGPAEVFAPRFPGLKVAVQVGEDFFPQWHIVTLCLGPVVWGVLHVLLTRTNWGQRVRAATQDRDMLDALGVNPAPLLLSVVVLGCGLAGLAGALQLPREPANLQMDLQMVVETFVVVVMGGLQHCWRFFCSHLDWVCACLWHSFFPASHIGLGISNHGLGAGGQAPRLDGRTARCSASRKGRSISIG
jgi:branched-chain amino acid transport system permease protein